MNDLNYLPYVIVVGALNYFGTDLAKFSSYGGTKVDLAAKGEAVETICCKGNLGLPMSGTVFQRLRSLDTRRN